MIMACMIMRLKLFFTPHLCLTASLITAKRYINRYLTFTYTFNYIYFRWILWFDVNYRYLEAKTRLISILLLIILLVGMSVKGVQNILLQRNTVGLYYWISIIYCFTIFWRKYNFYMWLCDFTACSDLLILRLQNHKKCSNLFDI